jgi:hypothetical protein
LEAYVRLSPEYQEAVLAAATAEVGAPPPSLAMAAAALAKLAALHASNISLQQKLREQTPSLAARAHAHANGAGVAALPTTALNSEDQQALATVKASLDAPEADQTMVLGIPEGRASFPSHIYLERGKPSGRGDSGWYMGAADEHRPPVYEVVKIADVLAARPDWKGILALPKGFVAHIDGDRITLLLNAVDDDLWSMLERKAIKAPV